MSRRIDKLAPVIQRAILQHKRNFKIAGRQIYVSAPAASRRK